MGFVLATRARWEARKTSGFSRRRLISITVLSYLIFAVGCGQGLRWWSAGRCGGILAGAAAVRAAVREERLDPFVCGVEEPSSGCRRLRCFRGRRAGRAEEFQRRGDRSADHAGRHACLRCGRRRRSERAGAHAFAGGGAIRWERFKPRTENCSSSSSRAPVWAAGTVRVVYRSRSVLDIGGAGEQHEGDNVLVVADVVPQYMQFRCGPAGGADCRIRCSPSSSPHRRGRWRSRAGRRRWHVLPPSRAPAPRRRVGEMVDVFNADGLAATTQHEDRYEHLAG